MLVPINADFQFAESTYIYCLIAYSFVRNTDHAQECKTIWMQFIAETQHTIDQAVKEAITAQAQESRNGWSKGWPVLGLVLLGLCRWRKCLLGILNCCRGNADIGCRPHMHVNKHVKAITRR
ncbi:hypothetical protein EUGRSUZ_J02680 [Eucalyptus grandis]|uniref:Uncharacterized protein n=2 Tax=Eucalyptus grandis TaxID=71139 RepID=A0ACC3JN09_EUCGR|nr:hypothetical protein EUGRSUZ_J02680 [Eucalyptus grandis]